MTMNKDIIIDELKDQIENIAYENQRMADFIKALGINLDDLVDYVIHGHETDVRRMIDYIIENNI